MGVGDEDGLQFSGYPSVIGETLLAVLFRMKAGIQEKRNTVNLQKIRISPYFLPTAEDRKGPGHSIPLPLDSPLKGEGG
jgi:hypothetical protein